MQKTPQINWYILTCKQPWFFFLQTLKSDDPWIKMKPMIKVLILVWEERCFSVARGLQKWLAPKYYEGILLALWNGLKFAICFIFIANKFPEVWHWERGLQSIITPCFILKRLKTPCQARSIRSGGVHLSLRSSLVESNLWLSGLGTSWCQLAHLHAALIIWSRWCLWAALAGIGCSFCPLAEGFVAVAYYAAIHNLLCHTLQ